MLVRPGLSLWLRAERLAAAATTIRPPLLFQPLSGVAIAQPLCGPSAAETAAQLSHTLLVLLPSCWAMFE